MQAKRNMSQHYFDTLKYSRKLIAIGFAREQAEGLAEINAEIINDNLATQEQVERIRADLSRDIKAVDERIKIIDERIAHVDERIKIVEERIAHVDERITHVDERITHVDEKIAHVDERIEIVRADLKKDIVLLNRDLTIKCGIMIGSALTLSTAILGVLIGIFH